MAAKRHTAKNSGSPRWYSGSEIPMTLIRRYARLVAEQFQPDKIILFGSFAYGKPHVDSDVDLLVVMPARNEIAQSVRIRLAIKAPFPLDLIVRTPRNLGWRVAEGDWFLREVITLGRSRARRGP
jgi:predicted nucleotidyltransferase